MVVFSENNIEQNMCEKVGFPQIRYLFIAEMGQPSSKCWIKQGLTAPTKHLVAIGELQCDFLLHQKLTIKQINFILTPGQSPLSIAFRNPTSFLENQIFQ